VRVLVGYDQTRRCNHNQPQPQPSPPSTPNTVTDTDTDTDTDTHLHDPVVEDPERDESDEGPRQDDDLGDDDRPEEEDEVLGERQMGLLEEERYRWYSSYRRTVFKRVYHIMRSVVRRWSNLPTTTPLLSRVL
jgi:hypothetical protein